MLTVPQAGPACAEQAKAWTPTLAALALVAAITAGCGRSAEPAGSPDATAVRPQGGDTSAAPIAADAAPIAAENRAPGEPPGTLEMPADFDPRTQPPLAPVTPGSADSPRGYEMPAIPDGVQAPAVNVSLHAAQWDEISAAITSTGKITVVDVWSLACEPCIKEFPGLVAMHRDLGDRVACFSVDVDYDGRKTKPAESYRPRVETFLQSVGATFPNFLSETPSDDLFAALGISSIPAVLVYDSEGKLIRSFTDVGADAGFTYAENVLPYVTQLLAQQRS